jgi:hypothetical protein
MSRFKLSVLAATLTTAISFNAQARDLSRLICQIEKTSKSFVFEFKDIQKPTDTVNTHGQFHILNSKEDEITAAADGVSFELKLANIQGGDATVTAISADMGKSGKIEITIQDPVKGLGTYVSSIFAPKIPNKGHTTCTYMTHIKPRPAFSGSNL